MAKPVVLYIDSLCIFLNIRKRLLGNGLNIGLMFGLFCDKSAKGSLMQFGDLYLTRRPNFFGLYLSLRDLAYLIGLPVSTDRIRNLLDEYNRWLRKIHVDFDQ
ncbi:hypothetical protein Pla8534_26160 [Lignipirellula cremea]|uniref:Uncharacterized protein n=1 Tax=Lignipirellula cremea TaxID=2528010 RepID=A0A518DSJ8_9BACT|nr:hypothetical protein Pla8534_26160 [Lignipirellula cremea]